MDGVAASKRAIKSRGLLTSARVISIAIYDLFCGLFGLPPAYVKIVGSTSDISYMTLSTEDTVKYYSKHPKTYLGGWKNAAPARTLALISLYNPIAHVHNVKVNGESDVYKWLVPLIRITCFVFWP